MKLLMMAMKRGRILYLCVLVCAVVSRFIGRLLLHVKRWFYFVWVLCGANTFHLFFHYFNVRIQGNNEGKKAQENQIKTVAIHLTLGFTMKNQTVADGDYFRYTWFYDDSRLNRGAADGKKRTWVFIKTSLRLILKLQ